MNKKQKAKIEEQVNKNKSSYDTLIKACVLLEETLEVKLTEVKRDKEFYMKKREEELNKK